MLHPRLDLSTWRRKSALSNKSLNCRSIRRCVQASSSTLLSSTETQLLTALSSARGRGKEGLSPESQRIIDAAVATLESHGGIPNPTTSPLIQGNWRLLYTTRPDSASPIQRTFVGVESFKIYQVVDVTSSNTPRCNNVVDFGSSIGRLVIAAEASTDAKPLDGFTPRRGDGTLFGLAPFGRSSTLPPPRSNMRIDFQFDRAAFEFRFLPFKIPYPVPFRYLGDERKGFIDTTYLSESNGKLRIARGNKGSLFILERESETPMAV